MTANWRFLPISCVARTKQLPSPELREMASGRRAAVTRLPSSFRDQPRGRCLYIALQLRKERFLVETGGNWVENLGHHRSGNTPERAARPEKSRVKRNRHARHSLGSIKMRDADFVAWLSTRGSACPLGKNDELPVSGKFDARSLDHCR